MDSATLNPTALAAAQFMTPNMESNPVSGCLAWRLLAAAILFLSPFTVAHAAEIQETNNKLCSFRLAGPIVRGDFDRLSQLVQRKLPFDEYDSRTSAICLKSDGGSYDEALKISEFVYNQGMSTVVEFGSNCFSSCAIIFMSGVMADRIAPARRLSAGGVVGFHAPYINVPEQKYSKEELERVALAMTRAIHALVQLSSKQMRLGGDFLKKSLIQRILEKGKDEVFFIRTVFDAARWDIEVYDAEEHYLVDKAKVRGVINMCNNFHYSKMDQTIPEAESLSVQVEEFSSKFHPKDFRILVRNSRTNDVLCELYPKEERTKRTTFTACSYDYWSSKAFGDCREYRTRPTILIGKYVPSFFALDPNTLLKRFNN